MKAHASDPQGHGNPPHKHCSICLRPPSPPHPAGTPRRHTASLKSRKARRSGWTTSSALTTTSSTPKGVCQCLRRFVPSSKSSARRGKTLWSPLSSCGHRISIRASKAGPNRVSKPSALHWMPSTSTARSTRISRSDLFGDACAMETDKEGRIVLPADMVAYAGLTDNVVFIGANKIFQIWEPAAGARRIAEARAKIRSIPLRNRPVE